MNKQEFLAQLRSSLAGLPKDDVDERVSFYGEMIDDRVEEGMTEEQAVAGVGPVADIVSQTVSEVPITRIVRESMAPKRSLTAWEIVLIVLGFPLWFPLLVAAAAVVFSLYAVLWSLIIALWAVEISLWACALAGIAGSVVSGVSGAWPAALLSLGGGFVCAGLSVFLFFGCVAASAGAARLGGAMATGIKKLFIRKDRSK
jgi:uncharacterized membrane protein